MTPWLALALAGAMEIAWALGLKYSDGFSLSLGVSIGRIRGRMSYSWSIFSRM